MDSCGILGKIDRARWPNAVQQPALCDRFALFEENKQFPKRVDMEYQVWRWTEHGSRLDSIGNGAPRQPASDAPDYFRIELVTKHHALHHIVTSTSANLLQLRTLLEIARCTSDCRPISKPTSAYRHRRQHIGICVSHTTQTVGFCEPGDGITDAEIDTSLYHIFQLPDELLLTVRSIISLPCAYGNFESEPWACKQPHRGHFTLRLGAL